MPIIELQPIREPTWDYDLIEDMIMQLLKERIYFPLLKEADLPEILTNSTSDLIEAIRTGRIVFNRGLFTGQFNAAISRELRRIGAEWSRRQGGFRIQYGDLPIEIHNAISVAEHRITETLRRIDRKLSQLDSSEIAESVSFSEMFDTTIWRVDQSIKKSLDGISVTPVLNETERMLIADEYTKNMRKFIKEWTEKEIISLREEVAAQSISGQRYDSLAKIIETSFGSSRSKARFLARQETNLFISKFKEARYANAGVDEYKWRCVHGTPLHPVRPRHKELDAQSRAGRIFKFSEPPIMDDGKPKNPGEDYGCRCIAIPIVRF